MPERRWVLDTNALISRLLLPTGVAARAVDHALARGVVLVSEETMNELAEVISRPKFDRYLSVAERVQFLRLFGGVARMVNITHRVAACRDPKDDKFLHVALNGEAEAIVTGDRDLLVLHPFHGISILSPADFVVMVQ
ncbi:putative toxin-antitoxin system toxin component, PIN family [Methyloversatilis sp. XJ19-13]|uniref:putative toxin-antitoxin system toxin component, PIN family n=1 Tax=Methyloversatilis sp. XJ19-13 TaxID=2963430 RepID=UPI00211BE08C|nr:putative toxin-antitoxin system toxin component, PIN family [Methyloversatilis sp. XJ19-13]MCQ9376277.1 putative toxin-antitoxin system toxin component, PIN family [Methyloversatilis sp. XJ19-13]